MFWFSLHSWALLLNSSGWFCQSTTLRIALCTFPMHLRCISEALLCTLMHCILDSACYATLHCPLHLCLHTCHLHLFVCLFVYLCHWHMCCLFCLFVSPSGLVPLIDGQWTSAKSDCTCSIRRGLGRRLRSSLLLNSSPRCDLPCRIAY